MKCDAGQPQCANCVKGKKECTYAAGRAKTKTQLLREKIQDLENKIKALEQQSGSQAGSGESSSSSPYAENGGFDDQDDDDGATSPDSEGRTSAAPVVLEDNLEDPTRSVRASAPWSVSDMSVRRPGSMLSPPKDQYELGRRITAFWNTYLLDKLGSAITSLPGSLPDEADPLTEILTPFPRTLNEYLTGDVRSTETATIRDLYEPAYWQTKRRRPETLQGLHVQITAIHERASRLSPVFLTDTTPNGREGFWQKVALVEHAITCFMREDLPGLYNTGLMGEIQPTSTAAVVNGTIFVIHTLAYLAIIQLHNSMAAELPQSYERVLSAARGVLKLAQILKPSDYIGISCEVVLSRECVYEPERTRTQKLLDKIAVLEKRLTELRVVSRPRASITHQDPMSDDTPSLVSEHGAPSTGSTLPDGLADPWYLGHIAFEDLDLAGDWWLQDPPPRQIQKYLYLAPFSLSWAEDVFPDSMLSPPKDNVELGERILLFWMVWYSDNICDLLSGLPFSSSLESETETVWPSLAEDYEQGTETLPDASVRSLFGPKPAHPFEPPCSMQALRCKSLAVLMRVSYMRTPEFRKLFQEYHNMLSGFLERLPPINLQEEGELESFDPPAFHINGAVFFSHTVTLVTFIQLYTAIGSDTGGSGQLYDRRLAMAKRAVLLIRAYMALGEVAWRSPAHCALCGYLWLSVAKVYAQHVRKLKTSKVDPAQLGEVNAEFTTVVTAIGGIACHFPPLQVQLDKLLVWTKREQTDELPAQVTASSSSRSSPIAGIRD
ncbi:hypothetical protein FRB96_003168 [Tulasnella sp. 330]|nr:hypothetical protein FRB96_003168 [Tulasnella sp. 330]